MNLFKDKHPYHINMVLKARVFISCGQRKKANSIKMVKENLNLITPEFEIAQQISNELKKLGYEPYIALEQQELKGVKEAIFKELGNSEYFLFIDFRREQLCEEGTIDYVWTGEYRGSLFSHQELAIATFQGLEVLAFQEEGVKKDDGILKFIQANCKSFNDRKKLPKIVASEVQKKWKPNWRNELTLNRLIGDYEDAQNRGVLGRYYHIRVLNNHKDKIARNCVGYIEHYKNLETGETKDFELVELKWKGVTTQTISIPPKKCRFLDAFHIEHDWPNHVRLGLNPHLVDSSSLMNKYRVNGEGNHELDYVVFSEDFSPAKAKFRLHLGKQIDDVEFKRIS